MTEEIDLTYLGDGVYAYHDGYQIWLKAERGTMIHRIALEPIVFAQLVQYERALREQYAAPLDQAAAAGPGHDIE